MNRVNRFYSSVSQVSKKHNYLSVPESVDPGAILPIAKQEDSRTVARFVRSMRCELHLDASNIAVQKWTLRLRLNSLWTQIIYCWEIQ